MHPYSRQILIILLQRNTSRISTHRQETGFQAGLGNESSSRTPAPPIYFQVNIKVASDQWKTSALECTVEVECLMHESVWNDVCVFLPTRVQRRYLWPKIHWAVSHIKRYLQYVQCTDNSPEERPRGGRHTLLRKLCIQPPSIVRQAVYNFPRYNTSAILHIPKWPSWHVFSFISSFSSLYLHVRQRSRSPDTKWIQNRQVEGDPTPNRKTRNQENQKFWRIRKEPCIRTATMSIGVKRLRIAERGGIFPQKRGSRSQMCEWTKAKMAQLNWEDHVGRDLEILRNDLGHSVHALRVSCKVADAIARDPDLLFRAKECKCKYMSRDGSENSDVLDIKYYRIRAGCKDVKEKMPLQPLSSLYRLLNTCDITQCLRE